MEGALRGWLRSSGFDVSDFEVKDSPDLRLTVGQSRIGCECTQIPAAPVYRWTQTRFDKLCSSYEPEGHHIVEVVWPLEVHSWVLSAVESKSALLPKYQASGPFDQMWLMLHAPVTKPPLFKFDDHGIEQMLFYGVHLATHSFDSIFFWSPGKPLLKLYPYSFSGEPEIRIKDSYPTHSFRMAVGNFKTTAVDEPRVIYDSGPILPDLIVVEPTDPEFKKFPSSHRHKKWRLVADAGATDVKLSIIEVE